LAEAALLATAMAMGAAALAEMNVRRVNCLLIGFPSTRGFLSILIEYARC
jgi:hypothetical protein